MTTVKESCVSCPETGEVADLRLYRDGDQWCATLGDFRDLQESPAGFGKTALAACLALAAKQLDSQG